MLINWNTYFVPSACGEKLRVLPERVHPPMMIRRHERGDDVLLTEDDLSRLLDRLSDLHNKIDDVWRVAQIRWGQGDDGG